MTLMQPFDLSGDPEVDLAVTLNFEGVALKAYGDAHGVSSIEGPDSVRLEGPCGGGGGSYPTAFFGLRNDSEADTDLQVWLEFTDPHGLAHVDPSDQRAIVFDRPGLYECSFYYSGIVRFDVSDAWIQNSWLLQLWGVKQHGNSYQPLEIFAVAFPDLTVEWAADHSFIIEVQVRDVDEARPLLATNNIYDESPIGAWNPDSEWYGMVGHANYCTMRLTRLGDTQMPPPQSL